MVSPAERLWPSTISCREVQPPPTITGEGFVVTGVGLVSAGVRDTNKLGFLFSDEQKTLGEFFLVLKDS